MLKPSQGTYQASIKKDIIMIKQISPLVPKNLSSLHSILTFPY